MYAMIIFAAVNEMKVAFTPAFGQNIANTNIPTKGPDIAPITLTQTWKIYILRTYHFELFNDLF